MTRLEELYQEMMAEKEPKDIKKVRYGDFYECDSTNPPLYLGTGAVAILIYTLLFCMLHFNDLKNNNYSSSFIIGIIPAFLVGISLHGLLGMLYHRLFLHKKSPKQAVANIDDPQTVLAVIAWQEGKFNALKNKTTTRIASNKEKAQQNKQRTEKSLRNLEERLDIASVSDLAPIYQERIACARILIKNFEQEILEAENQLKLVKKKESDIQEILVELRFYYDDVDASFILEEARKANIAIIQEREAIDNLITRLSEQIIKSSGLLAEIRDGKLQQASEAAACLELGYSPSLDLEHPGHETSETSIGIR